MAVTVYKTFSAGEVLTASDLNNSLTRIFDNQGSLGWPRTGSADMDGYEFILDADADTSITADTDDQIDFRLAGTDYFRMIAGRMSMLSAQFAAAEGAAVASATTTDIWTADGNTRHITGTTTITSFGTAPQAGAMMWVIFDGALTLTHGANLSLPGSANITTAADDMALVYADTTTQFDVLYFRKDGSTVGGQSLGTGDSPQFLAVNVGHATDTTVSRSGAGDIAVEGNVVYRAGGTNVPFSDIAQASGASVLVGRGSAAGAGDFQEITLGTGLSMSGTALSVSLTTGFTLGTEQAASGASVSFTGIPAGTKQIVITGEGISAAGTDDFLVQIGDAGGYETTGYVSVGSVAGTTNTSSTAGYIINSGGAAAFAIEFTMVLSLKDSANFTWGSFHVGADSGPNVQMGSGTKSLSAELTQVRIAFTGADTFDAGSFNIMYI